MVMNEHVTQCNNKAAGFGLFMGFAEKKQIEQHQISTVKGELQDLF